MRKNTNIISLILVPCILTAFLYGCGQHNETPASEDASSSVVTSEIAKVITAKIAEEAEEQATIEASDEENIELVQEQGIDYFVYKKIFDEYSTVYDTFDAVVTLSDGTEVYGVGYSDFSSYF